MKAVERNESLRVLLASFRKRAPLPPVEHERSFRVAALFGGGGGFTFGALAAKGRFREHAGTFAHAGAYDFNAYACRVYEYLTGHPEAQLDATKVTVEDIRRLLGDESPDTVVLSAPCKGSSKLLSTAKSKTDKYVAMNDLSYRGVLTLLDAYVGDEPAFLVFENVPNITTRAAEMLRALRALLRSRGYVIHDGYHDARTIGDLAQRRKRWFMVARNPRKVPVLLYRPPCMPGKVCGDVLGPLPLPNDPAGGPMHRLSDTSTLNLLRLWAIPAGGDWRDLVGRVGRRGHGARPCTIVDSRPACARVDLAPRGAVWFNGAVGVECWDAATRTVIGGRYNGAVNVADPRPVELGRDAFNHVDRVTSWCGVTGTITSSASSSNGAISVADPRPVELVRQDSLGASGRDGKWFNDKYNVCPWASATRTVIAGEANGVCAVADPRAINLGRDRPGFTSTDHVCSWTAASRTVTGATRPDNGAIAVADPRPLDSRLLTCRIAVSSSPTGQLDGLQCRAAGTLGALHPGDVSTPVTGRVDAACVPLVPQSGDPNRMHHGKYVVVPWRGVAPTVVGASRVGSGAASVADPRPVDLARAAGDSFHEGSGPGRLGVLAPLAPSSTITGNARVTTGPFAYAAPAPGVDLMPAEKCYDAGYGVLRPDMPSRTIACKAWVGCGAYALADRVPVNLTPRGVVANPERAARYGVLRSDQPSRTVTATTRVGCGAYALADEVPCVVDLALSCAPRADAYGVAPFDAESATVTAHMKVDNARAAVADPRSTPPPYIVLSYEETCRIVDGEVAVPFAVVDPVRPSEPLALVDDFKRPPYRWVRSGKKWRRETVALVLVSEDGTWHRPLTTLELAVLQAFPSRGRDGQPLDFGGGTTQQREIVGNAVPSAVAKAMSEQVLLSLLVSGVAGATLGECGTPVWVRNVRALERALRRAGYVVAKSRRPMNFTTGEVLDDGALVWSKKAKRSKAKKGRVARAPERYATTRVARGDRV